ncbi:hypothetical protein [Pleionea sp. CnH1-48]|uniref:hypothetical protein n=1 Tax=Pleionea sp. CnH1-48 TaxID=2954494 RepID=UPI002097CBF0|nr:hypothetical protein [Pleionea sp. CnH1-48]MCO7226289.1 hypothetical protein [Pleionea sp. CnH1-48]
MKALLATLFTIGIFLCVCQVFNFYNGQNVYDFCIQYSSGNPVSELSKAAKKAGFKVIRSKKNKGKLFVVYDPPFFPLKQYRCEVFHEDGTITEQIFSESY